MRGFKLGTDHDFLLEGGTLVFVDGIDAAKQEIETRLRLWLGEFFLDLSVGFPYLQLVFRKSPPLLVVEQRMAALIESVRGIQPGAVVSTSLSSTRVLDIKWFATFQGSPITGAFVQDALAPAPPVVPPEIPATFLAATGFSLDGTDSYYHADVDALQAVETMSLALSLTPSTPTATEYVWSKARGDTSGWGFLQSTGGTSGLGRLIFQSGGVHLEFSYEAEHIGRPMHFLAQRNGSVAELWARDGEGLAVLVDSDSSPGTPTTTAWGHAFGLYQIGTAGNSGSTESSSCGIMGGGYGTTFLDAAQVEAFFDACALQSSVPSGSAYPGAVAVYQAAPGLEVDQVGSTNLVVREYVPGDLTEVEITTDYDYTVS